MVHVKRGWKKKKQKETGITYVASLSTSPRHAPEVLVLRDGACACAAGAGEVARLWVVWLMVREV